MDLNKKLGEELSREISSIDWDTASKRFRTTYYLNLKNFLPEKTANK